jgi:gluconate 5-dehydrogenase
MTGTDLFRLDGRIAMVTGASRGLGRAIALAYAQAGATVILSASDRERLEDAAAEIRAAGGTADIEAFNLADLAAAEAAVPNVLARHGRLDILVNCGAISSWSGFTESTLADWQKVFDVDVTSMYLLCREAAKPMIAQRWGRIINFGSYVSSIGRERLAAYTAAKHAVLGLTRSIAGELARHNVTCNGIAPGLFDTDMAAPTVGHPERADVFRSAIAMGRFGQPSEITGPALFLASEAGGYVTGQMIHVDGGVANVLSLPVTVTE